jgi:hypothetical protein
MSIVLSTELPTERKIKTVQSFFKDKAGLVIWGKNCLVVALKSPHAVKIVRKPDVGETMIIFGLSGSAVDGRNFGLEFSQFERDLEGLFSKRELNFHIVCDFSTAFLREKFYNRRVERALAIQVVAIGIFTSRINLAVIDFDGEQKREDGGRFFILGCSDEEKRKELAGILNSLDPAKQSAQELLASARVLLREFSGHLVCSSLDFKPEKRRARGRKSEKKRNK